MKLLLFGLGLMVWASLLGCSPSTKDNTSEAVRIRWARDPDNLDPLLVDNLSAFEVINLLHCSLLKGNDALGEFEPWLAESRPTVQEQGDSLVRVTYRIRPEATWDNGSPVLARDVAFTLKVMNCPGLPIEMGQATYGFIRDIQINEQDARHFTLICAGQSPDHARISGDFSILPEYSLDPQGSLRSISLASLRQGVALPASVQRFAQRYQSLDLAHHPERLPGCGPYTLANWQSGRYLSVQRKKKWWADILSSPPPELQAFPTRITYQIIPDAATATLALRRGEIDLYPLVPAREFARLQQSSSDQAKLRFYTADSYEFLTANFNVRAPILQHPLTRQALSHLFNVPALIQATQLGAALPSVGLISPRSKQYYNDSLPLPDFNPAKAANLLRQAGWQRQTDGEWQRAQTPGGSQRLQLTISYRAGEPTFETVALQFKGAATALGIPVKLQPMEQSLLSQQIRAGKVEMSIRNLSGNPFAFDFMPILHSQGIGASNFTGFTTPASDQLIEQIVATNDTASKARLLRKFQRIMAYQRPFTVLYFLKNRIAASRTLGTLPIIGIKPGYEVTRIKMQPAVTTR